MMSIAKMLTSYHADYSDVKINLSKSLISVS